MPQLKFPEALNLAMSREMESDPNVFAFGVDAQDHKRTFGSGAGMVERFGKERFFGSPLSEAGASGVALGAALSGLRPIHIHARADFVLLGMNQIANMMSNIHYLSGGKLSAPVVVRAVIGRSWGQGAQHSKSMHGVFAHFPGLKVVLPASPQDAYSLLRAAIRDDNPVIFLEHRWLYDVTGEVDEDVRVPIGSAAVVREGKDVTVVACSWMTIEARQAADILARRGVQLEIVDARSVAPLDKSTIVESVRKTGRVVVADYDWTFCGFAAEIAAVVAEECLDALARPPVRIGFEPVPCPTTRPLETLFYPSAFHIVRAVEKLLDLDKTDLSGEVFNEYERRFRGPF
jgi:acetoin:2,6-dichlorophenolindophenol oxidoreductase subunit beta